MDNKFPGKDISSEDLKTKFPLAAKKHKNHFSKIKVNNTIFGSKTIPIMAGPNMVENEKMIIKIAKFVKKNGAQFLRGGAFKPLSFPYRSLKYNETREEGLKWLAKAKEETGIGIVTEVMEENVDR